jgi:hypothetical protein
VNKCRNIRGNISLHESTKLENELRNTQRITDLARMPLVSSTYIALPHRVQIKGGYLK